jgi:hypothetical protein
MPCTPDAFCSVHSSVMMSRTSFFFDAAVTTSAPRPPTDGATRAAPKLDVTARDDSLGATACMFMEVIMAAMVLGQ